MHVICTNPYKQLEGSRVGCNCFITCMWLTSFSVLPFKGVSRNLLTPFCEPLVITNLVFTIKHVSTCVCVHIHIHCQHTLAPRSGSPCPSPSWLSLFHPLLLVNSLFFSRPSYFLSSPLSLPAYHKLPIHW